jgi:hypothetical protein
MAGKLANSSILTNCLFVSHLERRDPVALFDDDRSGGMLMIEWCLGFSEIRGGIGASDQEIETSSVKIRVCLVVVGPTEGRYSLSERVQL